MSPSLDCFQRKIWGRKRHVLVDTQGLLLAVKVHAANVLDRSGARLLLESLTACLERVSLLFADHGYDGDPFADWLGEHLGWDIEIVPKPSKEAGSRWELVDGQPVRIKRPKGGFQVQRRRWVVERSLAWLTRYRRLARDYEGLPASSEALIQIAALRLCLTRLTPFRC